MVKKYLGKSRKLFAGAMGLEEAYDRTGMRSLGDELLTHGVKVYLLQEIRHLYME